MSITITDTRMTSDLVGDTADQQPDGLWLTGGPVLGPARPFTRCQALTALTLAEHLATWGSNHHCAHADAWRAQLHNTPAPDLAPADCGKVTCLYCGSTDVFETRVTIDDRTDEYALCCGECHGVWAA